MNTRRRRVARRLLEVFDYRTFAVAGAFATALVLGYLVFNAFQAAHDATQSADQRGKAASRRIDLLNKEIDNLQGEIAAGRDERGQLAASMAALAEQVRQMGGRPVLTPSPRVTVTVTAAPRSTTPARTASPQPAPTRTATPKPTPSPTRSCVIALLC